MAIGDIDNIFPTAQNAEDEFFISEAEEALRPRQVIKAIDELSGSTTIQDDDELFFSVSSNTSYKFKAYLLVKLPSGAPNIDITFKAPIGSTGRFWETVNHEDVMAILTPIALETEVIYDFTRSVIPHWFVLEGWIKTSTTAGNLNFRFAQTANDPTSVEILANSWMEITKQ